MAPSMNTLKLILFTNFRGIVGMGAEGYSENFYTGHLNPSNHGFKLLTKALTKLG